eukprot:gene12838-3582_t
MLTCIASIKDIWKILTFFLAMLVFIHAVDIRGSKSKSLALAQKLRLLPHGRAAKAPSLATAFQILKPENILQAKWDESLRRSYPIYPNVIPKQTQRQLPNRQDYNKRKAIITNRPVGASNKNLIKYNMLHRQVIPKQPMLSKRLLATAKGLTNRNMPWQVGNPVEDLDTKRQKLWYPGDQLSRQLSQMQDGIQTAFPMTDRRLSVTEMKVGPSQTLTSNQIYNKLNPRHFQSRLAPPQRIVHLRQQQARIQAEKSAPKDPKGYLNTVSLLLHQDGVNEDFNLGGTTLNSPYAMASYMYRNPNSRITKQGDYFGPIIPEKPRQEQGYGRSRLPKKKPKLVSFKSRGRSKQSYIEKGPYDANRAGVNVNEKVPEKALFDTGKFPGNNDNGEGIINPSKSEPYDKFAGTSLQNTGENTGKRFTSNSLEQADTENSKVEAAAKSAADPRWEKWQQEKNDRWAQYQQQKEERWKNLTAGGNENSQVMNQNHYATTQQGDSKQRYDISEGNDNRSENQARDANNYDYHYFTSTQSEPKGKYDYKADAKPEKAGLDPNTEEISPNGATIGNINVSLEKGKPTDASRDIKVGGQSKIVNLEVVDKGEDQLPPKETKKPEPEKGGVPEKGQPEKGGVPEKGEPEKGSPLEKEPDKNIPEKGGMIDKGEPDKEGIPEKGEPAKGGRLEKGEPEKGGALEKGEPAKGGIPEKVGPLEKGCQTEKGGTLEKGQPEKECEPVEVNKQEKEKPDDGCKGGLMGKPPPEEKPGNTDCTNKPEEKEPVKETKPDTIEGLVEQSLLDRMEKKLASVLSIMEYSGGIHTVEIMSSGCDDPPANREDCSKALGTIVVDGSLVSEDKFGFNIVVMDYPAFKVKMVKSYDTNMDSAKSQKLSSFLMGLKGTNIILVATKGDVAGAVEQEVWDTLTLFGARPPFEKGRRASFAFIGCRGECQLPWLQQVQRPAGKGPSTIQLIVGVNKEYVAFGGGGSVVFEAIKPDGKGASMNEGYNAGIPSSLTPDQALAEKMTKEVPHKPHEMFSSQEIIPDISSSKGQAVAASYLNRQESGEIGLGREVPMQAVDKSSPYGRGLHYAMDSDRQNATGNGGTAQATRIQNGGDDNMVMSKGKYNNEVKFTQYDAPDPESHSAEAIPAEAEADNEPLPVESMIMPNQVQPVQSALFAEKPDTHKEGEAIRQSGAWQLGDMSANRVADKGSSHSKYAKDGSYQQSETYSAENSKTALDRNKQQSMQFHHHDDTDNVRGHERLQADSGKNGGDFHGKQPLSDDRPSPANNANPIHHNNFQAVEKGRQFETGSSSAKYPNEDSGREMMHSENSKLMDENKQQMHGDKEESDVGAQGVSDQKFGDHSLGGQKSSSPGIESHGFDSQRAPQRVNGMEHNMGLPGKEQQGNYDNKNNGFSKPPNLASKQQTDSVSPKQEQAKERDPCKHCDIKPEVEFKLEASDMETGPSKCKGCGKNPELKPEVENLGMNVSVSNKIVSPMTVVTNAEDLKGPVPIPLQTKQNLHPSQGDSPGSQRGSENLGFKTQKKVDNIQELKNNHFDQNRAEEEHKNHANQESTHQHNNQELCKHCDVKPEVEFKLESSDMKTGPSKCKGCGKKPELKPEVENLGMNVSVTNKIVSPMKVSTKADDTMKFSTKTEEPMPMSLQTKQTLHKGYDDSSASQSKIEQLAVKDNQNKYSGSTKYLGASPNRLLDGDQTRHIALHDTPDDQKFMKFTGDKEQEFGNQKHYAERPENEVNKLATQSETRPSSSHLDISPKQSTVSHFTEQKDNSKETTQHKETGNQGSNKGMPAENAPITSPSQNHVSTTSAKDNNQSHETQKLLPVNKPQNVKSPGNTGHIASFLENDTVPGKHQLKNAPSRDPSTEEQHHAISSKEGFVEDQKSSNISTLVEIISKGMKALRESNIDLGDEKKLSGHLNKDEDMNRKKEEDSDDKSKGKTKEKDSKGAEKTEDKKISAKEKGDLASAFPIVTEPQEIVSKLVNGDNKQSDSNKFKDDTHKIEDKIDSGENNFPQKNIAEEFDQPKNGWHEKNCDKTPELCRGLDAGIKGGPTKENNDKAEDNLDKILGNGLSQNAKASQLEIDCDSFNSLPERQKRTFSRALIARYKKDCFQQNQKLDPLNVDDIKNEDGDHNNPIAQKLGLKTASGAKPIAGNIDKINLSSAKLKIASYLNQEAMSKPPSDFHPGYTTMAFPQGAAIVEKRLETMPDTSETFISRTARPDFSSLTAENSGKSSEMAFYFNQKNKQKGKDTLMRALPDRGAAKPDASSSGNSYDQGDVYQMADSLLQKDFAMAYKEASNALNERVENEQRRLNNQKVSLLAKRRLKKTKVNKPGEE